MNHETAAVRAGEELDVERLTEYLRAEIGVLGGLTIEQFPAGSSNLTYLIRVDTEEFVLRRPPFGNTVKTAHNMRREFEVLSKLSAVYPPAPKPIAFCDDASVIGSEFYLMERRKGLVIRGSIRSPHASVSSPHASVSSPHVSKGSSANSETAVIIRDLNTSQPYRLAVCQSFIRNLADLHALDYKAAGLTDLGHPDGYARRQVEGWTKRYFAAKTHEWPDLETAIVWLNDNVPDETGAALVHNDYKFDNIMLDPKDLTRITAVLDWEMVTIGDPLMDLGTTLGYWMCAGAGEEMLSMPFNPRVLMENISRRQLVEMYGDAADRDMPDMLYYYVFGTFKIAVISQQIYARFAKGFTGDPRFARFDRFVGHLGRIASETVSRAAI